MSTSPLLAGVRIIESSLLGPGQISTFFSDLGADVIKVEPPQGDYIRQMTWPIINGVSLLHLHTHRGKRSITLDLKTNEGKEIYKELVSGADAVVEAMRPGTLSKLGLGYEILKELNPKIVFCTLSGYGATGPYQNMPSHGIAYDTWAGLITPAVDEEGFTHSKRYAKCGYKCWSDAGCFCFISRHYSSKRNWDGVSDGTRPIRCSRIYGLVPDRNMAGI